MKHVIEGTVTYLRNEDETGCACCDGRHIYCQYLKLDEWKSRRPRHMRHNVGDFISERVLDVRGNEGKRVRVTVEVLP